MQLSNLCQLQAAIAQRKQRGGDWFCAKILEEEKGSAKLVAIPTGPIEVIDYLTPF